MRTRQKTAEPCRTLAKPRVPKPAAMSGRLTRGRGSGSRVTGAARTGLFPELRGGGVSFVSPVRDGLPEMRGGGVSFDSPVRGPARAEMRVERAERSRTPPSGFSGLNVDAVLDAVLASPSVLAADW